MDKVSIITVNYNQIKVTMDLLESIGKVDSIELEVIVVDNGSKHDETQIIRSKFPQVKVLRSEINLGFAGGNNLGVKAATGDFLFLVNNDTVISKRTVLQLKQVLKENIDVGIVCPLIYYYDNPEIVQYAGYTAINPITGRNKAIHFKSKLELSDKILETEYAHGAAMMIRRDVIDQIGLMRENYFLYYEELDWAFRIKQSGMKVMVDHRSHILHKESISTGKASSLKTYFQTRNRILFMRNNFKGTEKLLFYLFFTIISIPKQLIICTLNRRWKHLKSFLQGIKWNLQNTVQSNKIGYIYDQLRYS